MNPLKPIENGVDDIKMLLQKLKIRNNYLKNKKDEIEEYF